MPFDVEPLRRQLRQQQASFGRVASELTVSALRSAAPRETGELERSIKAEPPHVSDRQVSFEVKTGDLIQAKTTEFGRRGFSAKGKAAGGADALRFKIRGRVVIVKRVGPAPARPWFAPTVAKWPTLAARAWRRVAR